MVVAGNGMTETVSGRYPKLITTGQSAHFCHTVKTNVRQQEIDKRNAATHQTLLEKRSQIHSNLEHLNWIKDFSYRSIQWRSGSTQYRRPWIEVFEQNSSNNWNTYGNKRKKSRRALNLQTCILALAFKGCVVETSLLCFEHFLRFFEFFFSLFDFTFCENIFLFEYNVRQAFS